MLNAQCQNELNTQPLCPHVAQDIMQYRENDHNMTHIHATKANAMPHGLKFCLTKLTTSNMISNIFTILLDAHTITLIRIITIMKTLEGLNNYALFIFFDM